MNDKCFIIERKIMKIGNKLSYLRMEDLNKHGLTTSQSETILYFDRNDGKTITDLKEHLQVSHQAARKFIESLKKKELLYDEISEADGRFKKIHLTNRGQILCDELKQKGHSVGDHILKGIEEESFDVIISILEQMERNVENFKV